MAVWGLDTKPEVADGVVSTARTTLRERLVRAGQREDSPDVPLARALVNAACASSDAWTEARLLNAAGRVFPAKMHALRVPGVQLSLSVGGRTQVDEAWGTLGVEASQATPRIAGQPRESHAISSSAPMSLATRAQLGSLAKPLSCVVALTLVRDGLLRLDDGLGALIEDVLPAGCDWPRERMTARWLMAHVAGLPQHHCAQPAWDDPAEPLEVFARREFAAALAGERADGQQRSPMATPWLYTGLGWLLLQVAVERMLGARFEDLVIERVARPLGLSGLTIAHKIDGLAPNHGSPNAQVAIHETGRALPWTRAMAQCSSGLVGSARDVSTLFRIVLDCVLCKPGSAQSFLAAHLASLMFTTQPPQGDAHARGEWTLGLYRLPFAPHTFIHGGHRPGLRASLCIAPRADVVAVTMGNAWNAGDVMHDWFGLLNSLVAMREGIRSAPTSPGFSP